MYDEFVQRVAATAAWRWTIAAPARCRSSPRRSSSNQLLALATPRRPRRACAASCWMHRRFAICEPQLTPDIVAGALLPEHGFVVPSALSRALSGCGDQAGRAIRKPSPGAGASRPRRRWIPVSRAARSLDARQVVVAAGSWSGSLTSRVPPLPVRPVRGQLLHLTSSTGRAAPHHLGCRLLRGAVRRGRAGRGRDGGRGRIR